MAKVCDECNKKILKQIDYEITMGLNHYEFCSEKCLRNFVERGRGKYNSFYV